MKKKILVLGARGMLGNACYSYLSQNSIFEVSGTSSRPCDAYLCLHVDSTIISQLTDLFTKNTYDVVINCVGDIRPELTNSPVQNTFFVNAYFPKILDLFAQKYNFRVFHLSTDCVFDGKKGQYRGDDIPNEVDTYGLSKFLGEVVSHHSCTIRTSIVGIEQVSYPKNLLNWFLSHPDGTTLSGYTAVFWNGTTTLSIARVIERMILQEIRSFQVIQLGSETVSKYELLHIFKKVFQKDIHIKKDDTRISDKTLVFSPEQKLFSDILLPLETQIMELKTFYQL